MLTTVQEDEVKQVAAGTALPLQRSPGQVCRHVDPLPVSGFAVGALILLQW